MRALGRAALVLGSVAAASSLPRWLPARVVALRMWLFARINGDEGIPVPGDLVDVADFRRLYTHPAAVGRSAGAALSDLFWYWLAPGAHLHQEHLEPGERYAEVARTTRRILSLPAHEVEELAARCTAAASVDIRARTTVRLRDLMMPLWAAFFAEIVFGQPCRQRTRELIVAHADDVVTALKCCGLRHMDRRDRLTRHLVDRLDAVPHALPHGLTREEQALYLQGTFFNTAVVQMSEATAHLLLVLAQHPELQAQLADTADPRRLLDHVIDETLRLYPLFGIAHRITRAPITVDDRTAIPAGAVLCFDYPAYHRSGYDDPDRFDPYRWEHLSPREANHIPFGVAANRPCPAWHLAPIALRTVTREMLARFSLHSSAGHVRSIPNRGPCVLVPRGSGHRGLARQLAVMRARDRTEDVTRSLVQLVLGTYMVWDARRLRACQRYFELGEVPA